MIGPSRGSARGFSSFLPPSIRNVAGYTLLQSRHYDVLGNHNLNLETQLASLVSSNEISVVHDTLQRKFRTYVSINSRNCVCQKRFGTHPYCSRLELQE